MTESPRMLDESQRAELEAAAMAAARANQPRWLLYIGGIAVIIAGIYATVGLVSRASAERQLAREKQRATEIEQLVGQLKGLEEAAAKQGAATSDDPDPTMLERAAQLARDTGLQISSQQDPADSRASTDNNLVRRQYIFSFAQSPTHKGASGEQVLTYLKRATTELGLQIFNLELRPGDATADGKPGWKVNVTFTRWERRA